MNKIRDNIQLSVIMPAYNEFLRIVRTLESIKAYFQKNNMSYEIILIDDGSLDDTVLAVQKFAGNWPELTILENKENRGKGFSVNRGMQKARGAYQLFMDADNSVDISHASAFLKEMKNGADIIIGSIRLSDSVVLENAGWHRRVLGYFAKVIVNFFAVPGICDTQRGFKLFSQRAADSIFPLQTIERFGFDIELLSIAQVNGFTIKEMPVKWNNPDGSKVTLASYFRTFGELLHIIKNRISGKYSLMNIKKAVV